MKKVDPLKIGHVWGGLLSLLLAKKPSKWLYYENFFTLVTSKMHFEPLRGFFGQKWRKQTPPKMANFGGVYFLHFFSKMLIYWARAKSSLKLRHHPTIATSIFEKNPFSNFFSGHIFWPKNACKHQNLKIFWYSVHPNVHTLNTIHNLPTYNWQSRNKYYCQVL